MIIYKYGRPFNEELTDLFIPAIGHRKNMLTTTQIEVVRKKNKNERESLSERSARSKRISSIKKERRKENQKVSENLAEIENEAYLTSYAEVELSK